MNVGGGKRKLVLGVLTARRGQTVFELATRTGIPLESCRNVIRGIVRDGKGARLQIKDGVTRYWACKVCAPQPRPKRSRKVLEFGEAEVRPKYPPMPPEPPALTWAAVTVGL